ncbi:MAG: hypothetical protein H0X16_07830 [Chloroflexi bacterium]|nr:hypothetical protein [Chloroflexota bacterium]
MSVAGHPSAIWARAFRLLYALLGLLDPLIRAWHRTFGLGNLVELRTVGHRSGRRSTLLGLLRANGRWYLGHPNGAASWTRNLGTDMLAELVLRGAPPLAIRAVLLERDEEREDAIRATWTQHPFPGDLIYSLARDHVRARGVYFRVEPAVAGADDAPGELGPPPSRTPG